MADADRLAIRFCEEGTFGVVPAGDMASIATIACIASDDSYNDSGSGFVTAGFVENQTILVAGFTDPANNGYKHIVSVTAGKIIVEEALADEAEGDTVSLRTAFEELRFTGEGFGQDTDITESAEIRDDRQVADVKRTNIAGVGDINFEFSYDSFNAFLKAALLSAGWSDEATDTQITFSCAVSDNSYNDSGSGFLTAGFAADQWIEVRGFTTPGNNGYAKIVSVVAGKMIVEGITLADEVAGDTVTITMGKQILNGVTQHSYSIEKEFTDLTNVFALLVGMEINAFNLDTNAENLITGSFGFMGKSESSESATKSLGTAKIAPTNSIFSAVDDVEAVLENMSNVDVTQVTLALTNNLRNRPEVGELGPNSIGTGKVAVTGTLQMYFEDSTIMDKYLNFTTSQLAIVFEDTDGNVYIIDLPEVKYTDGKRVAGGQNTDIIADMSFSAFRDSDEDVTIRIARFDA